METHLQTLLNEWRVATDLSLWFSLLSPVAVSLAPGLQSSQAILGQLLIFSMGYLFPLLICSCWDMGRNSELLKRWQSFCRSTKSSGWFSLSYEWGTSPYPLRAYFWALLGVLQCNNSVLSSGSDMWQVFWSLCLTSFTYHLYLYSFIKYAINKKYLPFFSGTWACLQKLKASNQNKCQDYFDRLVEAAFRSDIVGQFREVYSVCRWENIQCRRTNLFKVGRSDWSGCGAWVLLFPGQCCLLLDSCLVWVQAASYWRPKSQ